MIQSVKPYVSSEDIDKGTRWSTDIAKELEASNYGIICVTRDSLNAPWVSFEAGSLAKVIDKSNVTPFLFNIKRSEVQGPLLQFQSVIYTEEDVLKLVRSINKRLDDSQRLSADQLDKAFGVWWPQLKESLDDLKEHEDEYAPPPDDGVVDTSDILEEILELARTQQRILSDPEQILPRKYLDYILRRSPYLRRPDKYQEHGAIEELHERIISLERLLKRRADEDDTLSEALALVSDAHDLIHEVLRRPRRKNPFIELEKPLFDEVSDEGE